MIPMVVSAWISSVIAARASASTVVPPLGAVTLVGALHPSLYRLSLPEDRSKILMLSFGSANNHDPK